ncbi:hypothetical protein FE257_011000 [Aspergillus nanangensis]|uniref:Uncharacterized protein n=1 Tax=Aspergillus nanangensis TaxID=2582783 RepID=A0AAD4CJR5_ASPNN|nr:hypothetical protein FE257_011000 [Aspergillus nanangensis]
MPSISSILTTLVVAQAAYVQALGSQQCHGSTEFGTHGDVDAVYVAAGAKQCQGIGYNIESGQDSTHWTVEQGETPYHFVVSWVIGCEGDSQPVSSDCAEWLYNDYNNCNNGGAGGWIDDGCVRYEFKPTTD